VGRADSLRALDARFNVLGHLDAISLAGINDVFVGSLVENLSVFQGTLDDRCRRAARGSHSPASPASDDAGARDTQGNHGGGPGLADVFAEVAARIVSRAP
jgi:hypothetical protein